MLCFQNQQTFQNEVNSCPILSECNNGLTYGILCWAAGPNMLPWRKGILTEVTCFDLTRCTHRLACRMSGLCDTAYNMTGIHHRNIVTRLRDNDDILCCDWLIQYLLNSGLIFSHVLKLVVFVFHLHCKATTRIISSLILHHAGPNPRYHIQTPVMITTSTVNKQSLDYSIDRITMDHNREKTKLGDILCFFH